MTHKKISIEEGEKIITMYKNCHATHYIAKQLNRTHQGIKLCLRRNGVTI